MDRLASASNLKPQLVGGSGRPYALPHRHEVGVGARDRVRLDKALLNKATKRGDEVRFGRLGIRQPIADLDQRFDIVSDSFKRLLGDTLTEPISCLGAVALL